jgi:hypothetical protein
LTDENVLEANELGLEFGVAVFEEEVDDLAEVGVELIEAFGLRVGAREAGDAAHVEPSVGSRSTTAVWVRVLGTITRFYQAGWPSKRASSAAQRLSFSRLVRA